MYALGLDVHTKQCHIHNRYTVMWLWHVSPCTNKWEGGTPTPPGVWDGTERWYSPFSIVMVTLLCRLNRASNLILVITVGVAPVSRKTHQLFRMNANKLISSLLIVVNPLLYKRPKARSIKRQPCSPFWTHITKIGSRRMPMGTVQGEVPP